MYLHPHLQQRQHLQQQEQHLHLQFHPAVHRHPLTPPPPAHVLRQLPALQLCLQRLVHLLQLDPAQAVRTLQSQVSFLTLLQCSRSPSAPLSLQHLLLPHLPLHPLASHLPLLLLLLLLLLYLLPCLLLWLLLWLLWLWQAWLEVVGPWY